MDWSEKFEVICELGKGGQGKVYHVRERIPKETLEKLRRGISGLGGVHLQPSNEKLREQRQAQNVKTPETMNDIIQFVEEHVIDVRKRTWALKVLHAKEDAQHFEKAKKRIQREIKAQQQLNHPHIVRIVEADADEGWFTMPFFPKGTLSSRLGNLHLPLVEILAMFRKIVSGVAAIHQNDLVHRDIKPDNIFLDENGSPVLGDFGIVLFRNPEFSRLSDTHENVGSRDWMPAWAYSKRDEDSPKAFDAFSLGKVLWSMISGRKVLPLLHFRDEEYNLVEMFPKDSRMKLVNNFLGKMIVEKVEDCLKDADEVMGELDSLLREVNGNVAISGKELIGRCGVCHQGTYELNPDKANLGFEGRGTIAYRTFICGNCGHVLLFHSSNSEKRPAWPQ